MVKLSSFEYNNGAGMVPERECRVESGEWRVVGAKEKDEV
jgi:hypothetical protein